MNIADLLEKSVEQDTHKTDYIARPQDGISFLDTDHMAVDSSPVADLSLEAASRVRAE